MIWTWNQFAPWLVAAASVLAAIGAVAAIRQVVIADQGRRAQVREICAAVVQYALLFGFAAVAAAISAHGLIGFARTDMGLRGVWPVLVWGALDGAAGLCAVLLMRRAARGESALAPRLAVWGLVASSSAFNWTHAPHRPGAPEAFAVMPVIAAVLFEFSLRESRYTAQRSDRRQGGSRWVRPGERIRVRFELADDERLSVQDALHRVRVQRAAWALHRLRHVQDLPDAQTEPNAFRRYRMRREERRAQVALVRVRFADHDVADDVLRHAKVLALTKAVASLDFDDTRQRPRVLAELLGGDWQQVGNGDAPQDIFVPDSSAALANVALLLPSGQRSYQRQVADKVLLETAFRLVAQARQQGVQLSQTALAAQLRSRGLSIANDRLRWLANATGLDSAEHMCGG